MKNLSCIIFLNKTSREFSFDSLQFNGEYYYLPQEYFGTKSDLILPITKKNNEWWIHQINCSGDILSKENARGSALATIGDAFVTSSNSLKVAADNKIKVAVKIFGNVLKEKIIEHNDYVSVENFDDNLMFSILFLENSKLSLNCKAFKLTGETITIGRADDNMICIKANESISRNHAIIAKDKNGKYRIESLKDKANFYVNGFLERSKELSLCDVIQIFDVKILFLENEVCVYGNADVKLQKAAGFHFTPVNKEKPKRNWFIRTPRIITGFKTEPVEINLPPQSQKSKPMPAMLTIGPSLTMSLVMFVSLGVMLSNFTSGNANVTSLIPSGAMAFSMLIGAILWPILTRKYQRKQSVKNESLRVNSYNEYIAKIRSELSRDNLNNRKLLNEVFLPSPETINKIIQNKELSRRMFEKTYIDSDYLSVRIGSGKVPSNIKISVPKQNFSLDKDLLLKLPYEVANEFKEMGNMPVTVSLKTNKTIGVIGDQSHISDLIRSLFMSLTFGHSYDEVKTVFIFRNEEAHKFEDYKKVLHAKTDDGNNRLFATTKDEVHALFGYISDFLSQQEQAGKKGEQRYPFFVFFIYDRDLVEGEPFFKRLVNPKAEDNFCSLFIYGSILKLPKECEIIIQTDNTRCGFFSKENENNKFENFVLDKIDQSIFKNYINYLQNIRIRMEGKETGIPEKVSLLGLYGVGNVQDLNIKKRWEENVSYKSIQAPIGIKSGGELFSLDIHENFHGPHGLAAGMTGSGKSELLQTLILSLAINYHPNDISFVLIDFKGGGMADLFDGMPHLAGKITNLSGSALRRSLISIDAEKERRQSVFKAAGVNSIDQYQKLHKKGGIMPLPHLLIIVDEFAQLKSQQPDFMQKLIDIAQIGRSLGIHLLLATQKPAGVVNDQIWGNSRFRMCLKVLEKQDSQEVIKKPDAAFIKLPGRCYVQVGYDEVYEYIQSGYSGAPYIPYDGYQNDEDSILTSVDSFGTVQKAAKLKTSKVSEDLTQLEAVVKYFKHIAKEENIIPNLLWLDPLKDKVFLEDVDSETRYNFNGQIWRNDKAVLKACVGYADYPETHEQKPVEINFALGSAAVYGISASGKTTFLLTALLNLSLKNSPENLNFYIFDFGSRVLSCFSKMPHTKALHHSDDSENIKKTIASLMQIMYERQKLFGETGVVSFEAYNSTSSLKIPAIVIVIDNYSVVTESHASVMSDNIVKLVREGAAYGIYLLVTGSNKSSIHYKVSDLISNNFALRQTELFSFREILKIPVQVAPEEIPGRGLIAVNKKAIEFQIALPLKSKDEAERTKVIKEIAETMQKAYKPVIDNALVDSTAEKNSISRQSNAESNLKTVPLSLEILPHSKNCLIFKNDKLSNKVSGLDLSEFKTMMVTDFDEEKAFEVMRTLLDNLEKNETNRPIFVFDASDKINIKSDTIKCFKSGSLSEGINKLKQCSDKAIIFIYKFRKFYDLITEDDASCLADFAVDKIGNKSNYILFDEAGNLNVMTLTPFMNNIIRSKNANCFLIGNTAKALSESVFEEIGKGRRFAKLNKEDIVWSDLARSAAVEIVRTQA